MKTTQNVGDAVTMVLGPELKDLEKVNWEQIGILPCFLIPNVLWAAALSLCCVTIWRSNIQKGAYKKCFTLKPNSPVLYSIKLQKLQWKSWICNISPQCFQSSRVKRGCCNYSLMWKLLFTSSSKCCWCSKTFLPVCLPAFAFVHRGITSKSP